MGNNEFQEPTLEVVTFTNEEENARKPSGWWEGEWGGSEQPDV